MAPYLIHAIQEDPVCSERVISNHQQLNIVKVYTRSIVIRGWDLLLLSHEYLLRKLAIYKPEAITIEKEQKQVFVTFRTRKDADRMLAAATFHNVFDEKHVRMAYASNYVSVLQHGDASKSGIYYLKASRLNKTFVKFAAREIGSHLITRHYDDIGGQLSEEEQSVAQSYGGIWLGGLQLEEPYKPKKHFPLVESRFKDNI
ncbi:hypothetical protein MIR68_002549 [Amoeboaphelidium protococcarum]|nr:hypothetical protein MIR68_002549 [Amoeboaphelidium protococcarum]